MLKRFWKGRPRGLSELPTVVRMAEYPADFWLREALLSVDGLWIRLCADNGTVRYWSRASLEHEWADNGVWGPPNPLEVETPAMVQPSKFVWYVRIKSEGDEFVTCVEADNEVNARQLALLQADLKIGPLVNATTAIVPPWPYKGYLEEAQRVGG